MFSKWDMFSVLVPFAFVLEGDFLFISKENVVLSLLETAFFYGRDYPCHLLVFRLVQFVVNV
jgi:hypothetical protein